MVIYKYVLDFSSMSLAIACTSIIPVRYMHNIFILISHKICSITAYGWNIRWL